MLPIEKLDRTYFSRLDASGYPVASILELETLWYEAVGSTEY
jgi:hypothetical protein